MIRIVHASGVTVHQITHRIADNATQEASFKTSHCVISEPIGDYFQIMINEACHIWQVAMN